MSGKRESDTCSIDTREELIDALTEAAELEHGLLVQYLFAAFSLKRQIDEGISPLQQAIINDWKARLLAVALEEMGHLGLVCNLLSAIGGAPRFGRPNFPQSMDDYYPFDFGLTRFADEALYRFICFELPEGETPPPPPKSMAARIDKFLESQVVPDRLKYQFVGQLYRQIAFGFRQIPENELFIGPRFAQDEDRWSWKLNLRVVVDRPSALDAIDFIITDGEGSPTSREGSHYDIFLKTRLALQEYLKCNPGFDPARSVVSNPQTRGHRDASSSGSVITNKNTLQVAELFNSVYKTSLLMLLQYYSFGGETRNQRDLLRKTIARLMSGVVRPLAESLTALPISNNSGDGNAGPGFELYSSLRLSPHLENRWTILEERFRSEASAASQLAETIPRMSLIANHLRWLWQSMSSAIVEPGR